MVTAAMSGTPPSRVSQAGGGSDICVTLPHQATSCGNGFHVFVLISTVRTSAAVIRNNSARQCRQFRKRPATPPTLGADGTPPGHGPIRPCHPEKEAIN